MARGKRGRPTNSLSGGTASGLVNAARLPLLHRIEELEKVIANLKGEGRLVTDQEDLPEKVKLLLDELEEARTENLHTQQAQALSKAINWITGVDG